MSLHQTVENTKKAGIGTGIGIGAVFVLYIFIKFIGFSFQALFPPTVLPPNESYGKLPIMQFPQDASSQNFTYTLNTVSGELPQLPDRLNVYQITQPQPNIQNLNTAVTDAQALGFNDSSGNPLPDIYLGNATYEWSEQTGLSRSFKMNIVSFNFSMTSSFLTSLNVLQAQFLSDQASAINIVTQNFLTPINLLYSDIDVAKTQSPDPNDDYITAPQLLMISPDGQMTPATSLSTAQVIRVDLYQNDIDYTINALTPGVKQLMPIQESLPIVYPDPPYSTMTFWVASGQNNPDVVQANFTHQNINIPSDPTQIGVYPTITAQQAFTELKNGRAFIASYNGSDSNIIINKVYLAYYIGSIPQQYLMPVVVFEGNNGFFAYVPALIDQYSS